MIVIKIPNNNINERSYIIGVLFNEFLGVEYDLKIGSNDYEIEFSNSNTLIITDSFFNKYPQPLEYLNVECIPNNLEELDIFAACFFMLSRWEEFVVKKRDRHNRFPASESLAFKQGFLDRPVVNEYLEKLKGMLIEKDSHLVFKKHEYELLLTHDVDVPFKYYSIIGSFRSLLGDLVSRKSFNLFFKNISIFVKSLLNYEQDPFFTFDYILSLNKKHNIRSCFFFMSGGLTDKDNFYKIMSYKLSKLIDKIKNKKHFIGFHPSYSSYNDPHQFKVEKFALESSIHQKVRFGRQHYLNFSIPETLQIWEDEEMSCDSSLGYAEMPGFRCGVCYEFSTFNILTRQKMLLKEKPLIVMECTIFDNKYLNLDYDQSYKKIKYYIDIVRMYKGSFVLLWHNDRLEDQEQKKLYEQVIGYACR